MIEFRRRLRAEWWNAVAAALAGLFAIWALGVLVRLWLPVRPALFDLALAAAVLVAALGVLGVFAVDYVKNAGPLRSRRAEFAYAALVAGVLAVLMVAIAAPFKHAAEAAYEADLACGADLTGKAASSVLCSTGAATVVRVWAGPTGEPFMTAQRGSVTETVQLDCPGAGLALMTARDVKTIGVDMYLGRIARTEGGGLVCQTTNAPSFNRTLHEVYFGLFGLGAALYGWWILFGAAQRARRFARQPKPISKTL